MITARILAKTDYASADGTIPLALRLTIHRKSHYLKLDKRCPLHLWDPERQRPHPHHPNATKLTQLLDQLQRRADDVILDHELRGVTLTVESFSQGFSGLNPHDFYFLAEEYLKSQKGICSWSYYQKVVTVVGKLKEYSPLLNLAQVDYAFIDGYMLHLRLKRRNTQNTINTNIKILRRIFRYGMRLKWVKDNPFDWVRLPHIKVQRDVLSVEEFRRYVSLLEVSMAAYHRKALVWFLVACTTGRRYGDLLQFEKWQILSDRILLQQNKRTGGRQEPRQVEIFLNSLIRRLLSIISDERLSPPGPSSRRFLKEVNSMAGVGDKKISFHSGRHTFALINKTLTQDLTIRRDLLGHDSVNSTLIYDHVMPEQLAAVMKKWDFM